MNFFERQRQVRRMSVRLVLLFVLAVLGIVVAVDLAALWAFDGFSRDPAGFVGIILAVSAITLTAIGLAALIKTIGLRGGGGAVARELGGVLVPTDTRDPRLRQLRNVVEEIAIASAVSVPEVYLLPDEDGINAFAAGWSTSDAAIAVTGGALRHLNRAELQGVIAHEFSHVLNGDMRLNIRLMGLLFGILFLSVIGRTLSYTGLAGGRGRDEKSNVNPLAIIGIALLVAGSIGVLAGRLIKAGVSRQREYLADASAVQFTRQTSGLVGALTKIAGLDTGSALRSPKAEEVGHMLFGAGGRLSSWFATHPPILDRIRALDPSVDPARLGQLVDDWARNPPAGLDDDTDLPTASMSLPAPRSTVPVTEAAVIAGIAAPAEQAYTRAAALIHEIPAGIADRARHPGMVVPLILGLLHSGDARVRAAQHASLARGYGQGLADAALADGERLAALHPSLRLPLAELAFPALRQRSAAERSVISNQVSALILADGALTVYEYCLSRLIYGELDASVRPVARSGRGAISASPAAVTTLLAILAEAGGASPVAVERSFHAGVARVLPGRHTDYVSPPQGVTALETVWPALVDLTPEQTQLLIAGVVTVISDDGVATVTELELLRTICAILRCPLPL